MPSIIYRRASSTGSVRIWETSCQPPTRREKASINRVWRTRSQLELSVVEYVSWFNHERLHESLGDRSPVEFESLCVRREAQLSNLS